MNISENIRLVLLNDDDVDRFVRDNQIAFNYGALEEFGLRYTHFEDDGEIISQSTIIESVRSGTAYRIWKEDKPVGGLVVKTDGAKGELLLLFVSPEEHSKGIGYAAWCEVERMYPEVKIWETCTPYFEKRNIHFYVNRCGFQIVEFFNKYHQESCSCGSAVHEGDSDDEMFRFEKRME